MIIKSNKVTNFDYITSQVTLKGLTLARANQFNNKLWKWNTCENGARSKQQQQWKDVALKVHSSLGFPKVSSATANVQEFDYNDATNKIGAREDDECFTEDFSGQFPAKK